MATVRDYHARSVGVPWCRKEDYSAFLAIMEDADRLPVRWEEYAKFCEQAERAYERDGMLIVRAYIDPETFPNWCAAHGHGVNSQGRIAFAASVAAEQSKDH